MSEAVPVLPYLIDPIGAAFGVDYSPGGALQNAITPAPPPPPTGPTALSRIPALPSMPSFAAPTITGPQVPPETRGVRQGKEPAGTGAGADVTRGLLAQRSKRTLLG
jgi:hypothetical protein